MIKRNQPAREQRLQRVMAGPGVTLTPLRVEVLLLPRE
jgi:hypothetical protein